ncbi:MAG TPA: putative methyltransferase, partial [Armatimonadetes bacterium]|nr:putative methyltransferase [Armatimonadota bacterium]
MCVNILDMQRELKERAGIFVSARDIERTLAALQTTTDIWTTVERSQVPMRVLCALLGILHEQNLIAIEDTQLILTDAGRAFCHEHQIAPWHATTCHTCNGRGVDIASLAGVVSAFREIARNRPEAIQDFDQGYVTEETTLARVAFLWWRGDLDGKEIIVLGDDDLVSIACALTGKPKRVVALDIDDRLISFIDAVSNERELTNLTTLQHDLREPLPDELVGKFDVFFTDPTE